MVAHGAPGGGNKAGVRVSEGSSCALRFVILHAVGSSCQSLRTWPGTDARVEDCVLTHETFVAGDTLFRNCLWLTGMPVRADSRCDFRACTIPGGLRVGAGPCVVADCIVQQVESKRARVRTDYCDLFGSPPFKGSASPGERSFSRDPQFRDPEKFDYRLRRTSPCRGKASDGGDIGCRYTPEMLEMLKLAFELRRKGIIKF